MIGKMKYFNILVLCQTCLTLDVPDHQMQQFELISGNETQMQLLNKSKTVLKIGDNLRITISGKVTHKHKLSIKSVQFMRHIASRFNVYCHFFRFPL